MCLVVNNGVWLCELYSNLNIRFNEAEGYIQLYYNGQWNNWISSNTTEEDVYTKYLYYKGTDYSDITGGWSGYAYKSSVSTAESVVAPTVTKNASDMVFKVTYGAGTVGSVFSGYAIDLTDYNYIEIEYVATLGTSSGEVGFQCVKEKANKYVINKSVKIQSTSITTATLNISDLSGSYFLGVGMYYSQVKIYSIKLVR